MERNVRAAYVNLPYGDGESIRTCITDQFMIVRTKTETT